MTRLTETFLKNKPTPKNRNIRKAWSVGGELALTFMEELDVVSPCTASQIPAYWKEIRCFLLLVLFGSIPVLCWEAGGECAVWLMHLCIVWILAEICLCAGEPTPPKLGSLTSCWWRKMKGAAHWCSWALWRKYWRWSWLLWVWGTVCFWGRKWQQRLHCVFLLPV